MAVVTGVARSTTTAVLDRGVVEYRFDRRGGATVVVFHGGHMNAGLALGEDVFADADYSVLVPSRPGYGRTPLATGTTPEGFADVTRSLCDRLGIAHVAAVVGISAGGSTAMATAARHPDLVERVVLLSAVGPLPWPDARLGARLVFAAATERVTWSVVRAIMRVAPDLGLRLLLHDLAALPARQVVAALAPDDRRMLIELFSRMRSGRGFRNDLATTVDSAGGVTQPTLVIASRNDGSVPFAHAEALASTIRHSSLVESHADSHFVWLGHDWPAISGEIRDFLAAVERPGQFGCGGVHSARAEYDTSVNDANADITALATRAMDLLIEAVEQTPPESWGQPSNLDDWSLRELVGHATGSAVKIVTLAEGGEIWGRSEPADWICEDPAARLRELADRLRDALPGADLDAPRTSPQGEVPLHRALSFPIADLAMHSWDVHRSQGRLVELPEDLLGFCGALVESAPEDLLRRPGAFGPAQPAPEDATPTARLMAHLGRSVDG